MERPCWLRCLAVLMLVATCVTTAWYCVSVQRLRAEEQELLMELDTSHGRERKQEREYAQVAA